MSADAPRDGIGRHLAIVFAAVVAFYLAGFGLSEWWRHRRGPWEVTFASAPDGVVGLEISQPRLGISGVRVEVSGGPAGSLAPRTIRFAQPSDRAGLPFGEVAFMDTTWLPGTVTFSLLGNEVELLPRVLIINKREYPWRSGEVHRLTAVAPAVSPLEASPGATTRARAGSKVAPAPIEH